MHMKIHWEVYTVNVEIFAWGVNFAFFLDFIFIAKISLTLKLHHDTGMKAF